jgi:hypothetical protein
MAVKLVAVWAGWAAGLAGVVNCLRRFLGSVGAEEVGLAVRRVCGYASQYLMVKLGRLMQEWTGFNFMWKHRFRFCFGMVTHTASSKNDFAIVLLPTTHHSYMRHIMSFLPGCACPVTFIMILLVTLNLYKSYLIIIHIGHPNGFLFHFFKLDLVSVRLHILMTSEIDPHTK